MSSDNSTVFTKENLDQYLRELSKEYKKLGGRHVPVEIILIGGAAIIGSYGFRDMTTDIDAILPDVSIINEAINHIADQHGLRRDWINADFVKTASYSAKLYQYSIPYKTFNQVLNVRIVTGEYLIAMKLRSGRKYKNDLSDVIGILAAHEESGNPITYEMIDRAVANLYGGWDSFSGESIQFIHSTMDTGNFQAAYQMIRDNEKQNETGLLDFQVKYPDVLNEENIDSIINTKAVSQGRESLLRQLEILKKEQKESTEVDKVINGENVSKEAEL